MHRQVATNAWRAATSSVTHVSILRANVDAFGARGAMLPAPNVAVASSASSRRQRQPMRRMHDGRPPPPAAASHHEAATGNSVKPAPSHAPTGTDSTSVHEATDEHAATDDTADVSTPAVHATEAAAKAAHSYHPGDAAAAAASGHAHHLSPRQAASLDRRIQRQLFLHRTQMHARRMFERMQRMRGQIGRSTNGDTSSVGGAHSDIEASVKRVFHRALVSRLDARLGRRPGRAVAQQWRRTLGRLLGLGGSSTGNSVEIYADGTAAWSAMWSAIRAARTHIHMESYIVESDGVGRKTMRLLADAARRGVKVHFCYDSWGSSNLIHTRADIDALSAAGAQVIHFNPIWHLFSRQPWRSSVWFRNHRKILIVDGEIGFCGGMNISSDYFGKQEPPSAEDQARTATPAAAGSASSASAAPIDDATEYVGGTGKFRDTHLRVIGPAVAHLERVSLDTFHEAARGLDEDNESGAAARERLKAARAQWVRAAALSRAPKRHVWYPQRTPALLAQMKANESAAAATAASPASAVASVPAEADICPVPAAATTVPPSSSVAATAAAAALASDPASDLFVQVLPSNVWRGMRLIQRAMLLTVRSATRDIRICNPYFFPPPALFRALQSAAARGVNVQILMAGEGLTDVPITRWASQHIYHTLLRQGVHIYELQSHTLHAKTVTIDGIYSSIGSFNWDRLSARRNLEVNLTILDPDVASTMESHFDADLARARPVTIARLKERSFAQRALHRVAYWVMRLL